VGEAAVEEIECLVAQAVIDPILHDSSRFLGRGKVISRISPIFAEGPLVITPIRSARNSASSMSWVIISTSGRIARARAIATRCFIPPESCGIFVSAASVSPTMARCSRLISFFSRADRSGLTESIAR
jgi:hypothetical protein